MKLSEHKELKKEILALPPKEKDKLLLRLVAKDKVLTEHLHFTLLEDESNLRDRVALIKTQILEVMEEFPKQRNFSAKEVLVSLRKLVKLVNHNFKVTKVNFEDVELRIFLLNNTIKKFKPNYFFSSKNYEQIFANFFVKAVLSTLQKFKKLHEDLQYDLNEGMNSLLKKAHEGNTADVAAELDLPEQI